MDSGASMSMSGVPGRIKYSRPVMDTKIVGFNGSLSTVNEVGSNSDFKREYYVANMPEDLVLLSAHEYATGGAIILLEDGGAVLKMNTTELEEFKMLISKYQVFKKLCVNDRTYEVAGSVCEYAGLSISSDSLKHDFNEAYSATASRFFNTKVHVSNVEERILTMLLTGFSYADLYQLAKSNGIGGLHPDINVKTLNRYMQKYGATPTLITLSRPRTVADRTGLKDKLPDAFTQWYHALQQHRYCSDTGFFFFFHKSPATWYSVVSYFYHRPQQCPLYKIK